MTRYFMFLVVVNPPPLSIQFDFVANDDYLTRLALPPNHVPLPSRTPPPSPPSSPRTSRRHPPSYTGDLFCSKAINRIFVGLYVQQVVLAALFFWGPKGTPTSIPEGALIVVLVIVTVVLFNNSYGPLHISIIDRIEASPMPIPHD